MTGNAGLRSDRFQQSTKQMHSEYSRSMSSDNVGMPDLNFWTANKWCDFDDRWAMIHLLSILCHQTNSCIFNVFFERISEPQRLQIYFGDYRTASDHACVRLDLLKSRTLIKSPKYGFYQVRYVHPQHDYLRTSWESPLSEKSESRKIFWHTVYLRCLPYAFITTLIARVSHPFYF